jgi:hypothetical protein
MPKPQSVELGSPLKRALCGLMMGLAALGAPRAWALDPPRDIWADPQWRLGLLGMKPGSVRDLRWTEQLWAAQPGGEPVIVSYRASRIGFDDEGRLATLNAERQRRGERDERRQLRYQWSAQGALARIDQDGTAEPVWARQLDATGRVLAETERRGAQLQRTVFKADASGREIERTIDAGGGAARIRERRTYHPNGALRSIETDAEPGGSRSVIFDLQGRPVKRTERYAQSLRVTQIRYPTPLTAVVDDSTATLVRGGLRKANVELSLRVRRPEEWLAAGEPEQPLSRREVRDGRTRETQTDFDDEGRPMVQRLLEGERVRCVIEWQYHTSGLPLATRACQPGGDSRCADQRDLDAQIEVDARGNWIRHVIYLTDADGRRVRMAEHTREIDYR